jgi:RNA polymerase primary sigma factor
MVEQHSLNRPSAPPVQERPDQDQADAALARSAATLHLENEPALPNDDVLAAYLREIRPQRRLSADEEQHLAAQLTAGRAARQRLSDTTISADEQAALHETIAVAEAARQRLVTSHLPLVVALARPYARAGVPLLDLIQEGNIGLLQAIEKFDPQRGARLATYAAWWIRQAIQRALSDQGRPIRLPIATRTLLVRLRRTHAQLIQQLGREPTTAELAAPLGIAQHQVEEILPLLQEPLSLEAPLDADGELALEDVLPDPQSGDVAELVTDKLAQDYVRATLAELTAEEQQVLTLRYGLENGRFRSLDEVGTLLGRRRDQVRKIEGHALRKLRHPDIAARLAETVDPEA